MRSYPIFIIGLLCVTLHTQSFAVKTHLNSLPEDDKSTNFLIPPHQHEPIEVHVGIYLQNIREINESQENFHARAYIHAQWKDPRLAFDSKKTGLKEKSYDEFNSNKVLAEIWWPSLILSNALEKPVIEKQRVSIFPDGSVFLERMVDALLYSPLYLQKFPFDSQTLAVKIQSYYGNNTVKIVPKKDQIDWNPHLNTPGWTIENITSTISQDKIAWSPKSFDILSIGLNIKRDPYFFLWRLVLPLVLLVVMTWSIFWMDGERLNDRIKVCSYGFLTSVTFSLAVSTMLPKVSYLTFLDKILIGTYIYIMLAAIESSLRHIFSRNGREELAYKIDYWCRPIFPLTYVLLWAIIAKISF
ncbi:MAG TPA: hypothetical protein DIU37_02310 [Opitutae bacterium]|nr:hypothetical protein [Opitutae bacterium]|tara:strand:- start:1499 stop:2569 length:1071 start_codon:yes stop_codon:yes gene_type:complete